MTAIETSIADGLLEHLGEIGLSPVPPIAYPNLGFVPPTHTAPPAAPATYLRATLLPAITSGLGLDQGDSNLHGGLLQVDVFFQKDRGLIKPTEMATAVIAHFKRGTVIWKDGHKIEVLQPPYVMAARQEPDWIMIPVRIVYVATAPDPA